MAWHFLLCKSAFASLVRIAACESEYQMQFYAGASVGAGAALVAASAGAALMLSSSAPAARTSLAASATVGGLGTLFLLLGGAWPWALLSLVATALVAVAWRRRPALAAAPNPRMWRLAGGLLSAATALAVVAGGRLG